MRRVLAATLVAVFTLPLVSPVFTARIEVANLPPCCRRNGKHHCMMYRMAMGWIPPRYRTVSAKCPWSPFAGLSILLFHGYFSYPRPAAAARSAMPAQPVRQADAGYRISFLRARQKRGPPRSALA